MKILQVCPRYYPHIGGVETHVRSVSQRLQKAGFEVEIYSTDAPPGALKQEILGDIQVTRFPSISPHDTVYFSSSLRHALNKVEADLIHAHNYRALPMLFAARVKRQDIPLVVTMHLGFSKIGRWIYYIYDPIFGKKIFDRANRIIVCTPAELTEVPLLRGYEYKIAFIPNGVDLTEIDSYHLARRQPKTILDLLYVGRIERKKGIGTVIETVNHLKGLPVRLRIAGDGPDRRMFQGMVDKLGLNDVITFEGSITNEKLYPIFSTSDVFLLLSEFEASSIALAEAMAFGLVPIVTRVGGNPYMVDDEVGYVVDYPANTEEVATILKRLVSDTKLLKQKSQKTRQYAVTHLDIETQMQRIIEIYEAVKR